MDKDKIKLLTELLAIGGAIIGLLQSNLDSMLKIVITIIVIALIVGIIVFQIIEFVKSSKSSSSRSIASKTSKFTNYLLKIAKINEKKLRDYDRDNFNAIIDRKNRKIIKLSKKGNNDNEEIKAKIAKLKEEKIIEVNKYFDCSTNLTHENGLKANKNVLKISKLGNYEQTIKEYDAIYKCIIDMRRILLDLDEHEKRIRLGKYIIRCSKNVDQLIDSYIDMLGWTYILIGEDMKGINAILSGIDLLGYQISHSNTVNEKVNYLVKKARALRHIGTTYYTFSHKDKIDIEKYNNDSLAIMESDEVYDFYHPQNCDLETKKSKLREYNKMVYCIKYNMYVFDYYMLLNMKEKSSEKYINVLNKVNDLIDKINVGFNENTFDDNHRLSKCLTLKNQISMKLHTIDPISYKEEKEFLKEQSLDFKQIEGVFNKNIYFDEAMEVYVYQKIDALYDYIETIYK